MTRGMALCPCIKQIQQQIAYCTQVIPTMTCLRL